MVQREIREMGRGAIVEGPVGFGLWSLSRAVRGPVALSDIISYAF